MLWVLLVGLWVLWGAVGAVSAVGAGVLSPLLLVAAVGVLGQGLPMGPAAFGRRRGSP